MLETLKALMETDGISGDEIDVRNFIMKDIRKHVDDITVDNTGNLFAHKKGGAPRVMLAAHMDEIGLMVKNIDDSGNIFFSRIGGAEPITLIGQRVKIKTGKDPVFGVITTPLLSNGDPVYSIPKVDEMHIDTGLEKEELAKAGVRAGTFIALQQETCTLSDKIIYGRALDDRIGCYILLELARRLKKTENEVYFVFTVQEEIGVYGAKTSAYKIRPDWAIAIDVTNAEDRGSKPHANVLGGGPCITLKDAGMITNKCLNIWLEDTAKRKSIPLQYDVGEKGTTDALSISLSREGVPATVLGVAVRNLHSTIGMASINDIENTIRLLEEFLANAPKECVLM